MKSVCAVCGAAWKEDVGFTEPHYFPCVNNENHWNFTRQVPNKWVRPKGEPELDGYWVGAKREKKKTKKEEA